MSALHRSVAVTSKPQTGQSQGNSTGRSAFLNNQWSSRPHCRKAPCWSRGSNRIIPMISMRLTTDMGGCGDRRRDTITKVTKLQQTGLSTKLLQVTNHQARHHTLCKAPCTCTTQSTTEHETAEGHQSPSASPSRGQGCHMSRGQGCHMKHMSTQETALP